MESKSENEIEIITKIEKLLRLATSSNPNEALVAMKKARELMLRYHIDEMRVHPENEIDESVLTMNFTIKYSWEANIYTIVAKNMRCTCYYCDISKQRYIILIGYKADIDATNIMSTFLISICIASLKKERQTIKHDNYCDSTGLAKVYRTGFVHGIHDAFVDQNKSNEFALMIILPKKVAQETTIYRAKHNIVEQKTHINKDLFNSYKHSYRNGYDRGYESAGKKQLSS